MYNGSNSLIKKIFMAFPNKPDKYLCPLKKHNTHKSEHLETWETEKEQNEST